MFIDISRILFPPHRRMMIISLVPTLPSESCPPSSRSRVFGRDYGVTMRANFLSRVIGTLLLRQAGLSTLRCRQRRSIVALVSRTKTPIHFSPFPRRYVGVVLSLCCFPIPTLPSEWWVLPIAILPKSIWWLTTIHPKINGRCCRKLFWVVFGLSSPAFARAIIHYEPN